jgi:DNA-directed RNA polymerase subunit M/transcription elongation factor TFIIS
MAATISISCPKCSKTVQAPDSVKGKKIKCKGCGEIFPAEPTATGKPKPGQDKGKQQPAKADPKAKGKPKGGDDEEWGEVHAYGVTKESDKPRCPFCAWELEDAEDVLCLKCGYNLQTRERLQEKVLEPVTTGDYVLWLLPGILCAIVALSALGMIIYAILMLIFPPEDQQGSSFYRMVIIYGSVFAGVIGFLAGRFAVKRLILNPHPPEREKKLKKDE